MSTPSEIWQQIEREAKSCQRTWGMGFPVISTVILAPLFERATGWKPPSADDFTLEAPEPKGKFRPPTLAMWQAYGRSLSPPFPDHESAAPFDHFTANGWKVSGKAPMQDWQAACRNCHRRWLSNRGPQPPTSPATGFHRPPRAI